MVEIFKNLLNLAEGIGAVERIEMVSYPETGCDYIHITSKSAKGLEYAFDVTAKRDGNEADRD